MANYPECPVDLKKADESQVRVTASLVVILSSLFLITGLWHIPALLTIDFLLRALKYPKVSILAQLSRWLVYTLKIKSKPIDRGPKIFAAKIGFIFSVAILGSALLHFTQLSLVFASVLCIFAFLESAIGFCAACHIYPYFKPYEKYF